MVAMAPRHNAPSTPLAGGDGHMFYMCGASRVRLPPAYRLACLLLPFSAPPPADDLPPCPVPLSLQLVIAVVASVAWMAVSSGLILLNKDLLSHGFHYPMALSGLGMAFSGAASYLCCKVGAALWEVEQGSTQGWQTCGPGHCALQPLARQQREPAGGPAATSLLPPLPSLTRLCAAGLQDSRGQEDYDTSFLRHQDPPSGPLHGTHGGDWLFCQQGLGWCGGKVGMGRGSGSSRAARRAAAWWCAHPSGLPACGTHSAAACPRPTCFYAHPSLPTRPTALRTSPCTPSLFLLPCSCTLATWCTST